MHWKPLHSSPRNLHILPPLDTSPFPRIASVTKIDRKEETSLAHDVCVHKTNAHNETQATALILQYMYSNSHVHENGPIQLYSPDHQNVPLEHVPMPIQHP